MGAPGGAVRSREPNEGAGIAAALLLVNVSQRKEV